MARSEIRVCMYRFHHEILANVLLAKVEQGCHLTIATNSNDPPMEVNDQVAFLKNATYKNPSIRDRIRIFTFTEDDRETVMHNKYVIIDNWIVMHGGLNWTKAGIEDQFNTVVVSSDRFLVRRFIKNFDSTCANSR